MEFARPYWLALLPLVLVPLALSRRAAFRFPTLGVVPRDPASQVLEWVERGLGAIFVVGIVLGLSEPQRVLRPRLRWVHGVQVVFVVDQSASMFAPWHGRWTNPLKIDVAHRALAEFLDAFPTGRWALVGFGRTPVVYTAGTSDPHHFRQVLRFQRADFGDTVIDTALQRALELTVAGDFSAVVLLSDGAGRVQDPDALARAFQAAHRRLYWIAVQGPEEPIPEMFRLMTELGPWGATIPVSTGGSLGSALRSIGLRERRLMALTPSQSLDGRRFGWTLAGVALLGLGGLGFSWRSVWASRGSDSDGSS
ncbi:MAG: VWA domain-containing protein [Acidobacteria bacterium]|nr:VWA domain-containing protein [Acidobacteriota bacterium]MDW7983235.1 VWA domain-containing protein [Acidobacteriota bacterium]